jgi:hypothetical protein
MACARLAAAFAAALAVALPAASAHAAASSPTSLHGFALRADEAAVHTFSRTPSFAWNPVPGAVSYEFELATSRRFSESGMIWSTTGLKSPTVAVPISLPWISGNPYSLYAHARAITRKGTSPWSTAFGFNMRWPDVPTPVTPATPGLLRWTPVPGATAYVVWLTDVNKQFVVRTNMADEREYYTFHQDPAYSGVVHWRVKPMRWLYGTPDNALPSTSFGPWSPIYASYNPPFLTGPLKAVSTISNVVSNASATREHEVMPAFTYQGNTSIWNTADELYRVIVFTDEDCLNPVFRGAVTGAPAYSARATGPLGLPTSVNGVTGARTGFLLDGTEPDVFTYDGRPAPSNESDVAPTPAGVISFSGRKIDLWDSDWPTGRYYWTAMPIDVIPDMTITTQLANPTNPGDTDIDVVDASGIGAGDTLQIGSPLHENAVVASVLGNTITLKAGVAQAHLAGEDVVRPSGGITYREAELTQDSCASGRRLSFGKTSEPVVTGQSAAPFASGLSPVGKLVSARTKAPKFYGQPLVAWQPLVGADQYELQVSKTGYPWKTVSTALTFGTSMTLPLTPGTWFYRVRGIDFLMTGTKPQLSWSDPVRVVVTKPRFRVIH